jgi:hypothetical protein
MQPDHDALLAVASQRFGKLLHVSGNDTGTAEERAIIDVHLADIGRLPEPLVARVVEAGLRGVFVGAGAVPDLDEMQFLRGR